VGDNVPRRDKERENARRIVSEGKSYQEPSRRRTKAFKFCTAMPPGLKQLSGAEILTSVVIEKNNGRFGGL
jgi:hypothetical protein